MGMPLHRQAIKKLIKVNNEERKHVIVDELKDLTIHIEEEKLDHDDVVPDPAYKASILQNS